MKKYCVSLLYVQLALAFMCFKVSFRPQYTVMYTPRLGYVFFYTQTLNCGNFKGPKYKSVMVWGFSPVQVELLR